MKKKFRQRSSHLAAFVFCLVFFLAKSTAPAKPPVDYVNPFIGTDAHGHVYPGASVPFGMVQLSPDTRDNTWDGSSGYHYSDGSILGFSMNHLTGTGCPDLGNILFMPTVGEVKLAPGGQPGDGYRARFSHSKESARPGYYEVRLPDYNVEVELTASARAGMQRYTFPATDAAHVVLDLQHGIGNKTVEAQLSIEDSRTASGYRKSNGWGGDKTYFFVIEFSRAFDSASVAQGTKDVSGKSTTGGETKGHFDFKTAAGEKILVRTGLSTVSIEGARANLHAEMPGWDFDGLAAAARKDWNAALGRFTAESKDENLAQTFYTALYHTMVAPTLLSDVDGQFRGPDEQVHVAQGFDYYTEISVWDIFRAEVPLLTLDQPARVNDIVSTMLAHFKIFGHQTLPVWPEGGKETWCMIGNHALPMIATAYLSGLHDWNAAEALNDMITTTDQNREQLDAYRERGFVPTGKDVQSVSKTLEYAYDDSCLARFAQALGRNDVAEKYFARAQNWTNVFDPSTSFMRGRNADGGWVTPFGENEQDSINFNEYTEANAWQYNFFVPQDVPALIAKLGGDDKFCARIDEMFDTKQIIPNLHLIPDVTGVIGMYSQGNEPDQNFPYLYNYAGQPWKTQARVRQVASLLYTNTPDGICGNDDCGQISAWYVFAALGFYPSDPASGIYLLGSPLMDKVTLHLDPKFAIGRAFSVIAKNNSAANCYIQSAKLNGKSLTRSWISQGEITGGGKLVLEMGPQPNKIFGSAQADRPPKN